MSSNTEPRANEESIPTSEPFSTRITTDPEAGKSLQDPGHNKVRTQPESASVPENVVRVLPPGEQIPQGKDTVSINPEKDAAQREVDGLGATGAAGSFSAADTLGGATSGDFTGSIGQPVGGVSSQEAHHVGHGTDNEAKMGTVHRKAEDHDHEPRESQGFRGDK